MTKCLLISSTAKIHSNLNFISLDYVNEIIEKYYHDKNQEIQQRCLEYKRNQSKNVVIEKNQFTTINDEFELVTSLSFLNTFVQSRANGKTYDENISDRLWEIQFWFSSIECRTIQHSWYCDINALVREKT